MSEQDRSLRPEDYAEPRCLLGGERYGSAQEIVSVPQQRIAQRLDEYLSRRDYAGAERHLLYWLEEARLGRDLLLLWGRAVCRAAFGFFAVFLIILIGRGFLLIVFNFVGDSGQVMGLEQDKDKDTHAQRGISNVKYGLEEDEVLSANLGQPVGPIPFTQGEIEHVNDPAVE